MDIEKLASLLGHSSSSDELDDRLLEMGITKRPKASDDHRVSLKDTSKTVTLMFYSESSFKEYTGLEPLSRGWYIFSGIELEKKYSGEMPFNLRWQLSRVEAKELLGVPVDADDQFPIFFFRKMIVVLRYTSVKSDKIDTIGILVPRVDHRSKYGI